VSEWSQDNLKLYQLILENGMAEFICNKEFLFEFYQTLSFVDKQLSNIDSLTLKLSNLRTLNLVSNNISTIENIP
jgi:Leucine-rich repeat (LRR) protein